MTKDEKFGATGDTRDTTIRLVRLEKFDKKVADFELKSKFLKQLFLIFLIGNIAVLILIAFAFAFDTQQINCGTISPDQRLINENVILALVAATAAQVAAGIASMAISLFPRAKKNGA